MILDITGYSEDKPFLLIDVDGVVNVTNRSQNTKTYKIFKAAGYPIRIRHEMPDWLFRLSGHFHLVWCTMWDDLANTELSPELDLPSLPYIPCWESQETVVEWNGHALHTKIPLIADHMKERPFAFVDDWLRSGDMMWAAGRNKAVAPTKFLPIDPRMGLLEHHVNKLVGWAIQLKGGEEVDEG